MKKQRTFTLIELLLIIAVNVLLASMVTAFWRIPRESDRRASCTSNLKQLGCALEFCAQCTKSLLRPHGVAKKTSGTAAAAADITPDAAGASNAMEVLRSNGTLTDHKVFVCPSATASAVSSDMLATAAVTSAQTAVGKITSSNHTDFGNFLYADGHVAGYANAKWYTKENIGVKSGTDYQVHPNTTYQE